MRNKTPIGVSISWSNFGALVFSVAMLCIGSASAADIQQDKPKNAVGRLIESDVLLSGLNYELDGALQGARNRSNDPAKVEQSYRDWLKTRDACGDKACLIGAYDREITDLSNVSDEPLDCVGSPMSDGCAAQHSHRVDLELDQYVGRARRRILDRVNVEPNWQAKNNTLSMFDAAQAAWVVSRKAECNAAADWEDEQRYQRLEYERCWQSLTKSRILRIWQAWLTFEDDTPPLMPQPVE